MKITRITAIVMLAAAALVLSAGTVVSASGESHEVTEILVEKDFHHLGDFFGCQSCVNPDPEGVSWETTVRIPRRTFDASVTAHLQLRLIDSDSQVDSFVINGRSFALPDSTPIQAVDIPLVSPILISIPLGLLEPGSNTIGFAAGQFPGGGFDDFEFGEVVLLLSS